MSNPYVAFAQKDREGNWRQFRSRDDVTERQGYWALRADGTLHYVNPMEEVPANDRFAEDQTQPGSPGLLGTMLRSVGNMAAGVVSGVWHQPFGVDSLGGNPDAGEELSPEMRRAMRAYLKASAGIDGPVVTNESAPGMIDWVQKVKLGMYDTEDLYDALWASARNDAHGASRNPQEAARAFINLFSSDGDIQRANAAISRGAEFANVEAAGRGDPADFNTALDGAPDRGVAGAAGAKTAGAGGAGAGLGASAAAATGSGGAGLGGSGGLGGVTAAPKAPGTGPGGVQVTSDMLKEFVNSDFSLAFNKVLNGFRDAGAAAMFVDWFSKQLFRYQGEYEGEVADQALGGQVPTGSWTSFLARKGLLDPSLASDVGGNPMLDSFTAAKAKAAGTSTGSSSAGGGGGALGPMPAAQSGSGPLVPSGGQAPGLTPNGLGSPVDPVAIMTGY